MAARHRPRTSMIKEDNGDELALWNSIVERIRRCSAIDKQYETAMKGVLRDEEAMQEDESPKKNFDRLQDLEKSHRDGLKLAEDELKILHEEPDDLIRNLETLVSVRTALEVDTPRSATAPKSRPPKRRLDTDGAAESPAPVSEVATPLSSSRAASKAAARSGSVSATSVKQENGVDQSEALKGTSSGADKQMRGARLVPDAEVFFRSKKHADDGEGILCKIISVSGEGKHRRCEIQDSAPEPDSDGNMPPVLKVSAQALTVIPLSGTTLPDLPKGRQVLAKYPDTTTFYKAELIELIATKKDKKCTLRFEGEEDPDNFVDVDRRYVLDVK
ncbi:MAG: SAGA HAT/Core module component [Chrysothrix sp. TS-e1954]|nr:MAG: SAGA HAT/Core module component [Chrysothrix sp. TS-e1954]